MARKDLERKRIARRYRVRGCLYNAETILGAGFLIICFIVVEGILITNGLRTLLHPNTITCGDQTMAPGDTCEDFPSGNVTNYEQARQSSQVVGLLELIASPLVLIGGIFLWRYFFPKQKSVKSSSPNSRRSQTKKPSQSGASPPSSPSPQPEGRRRESS